MNTISDNFQNHSNEEVASWGGWTGKAFICLVVAVVGLWFVEGEGIAATNPSTAKARLAEVNTPRS